MASGITTAFWGMTINNYDETDLALVRQGYPDYCRKIVYTLEKGAEGTPHIQAWIKLQRQQRLSFVKKLFPRGHFKPLTSDQYIFNTERYAQKLDDTAQSPAVIQMNDPIHTLESVIKKLVFKMVSDDDTFHDDLDIHKKIIEREMVKEDYKLAKIFVSATYQRMWKDFGHEMYECIFHQYTHTHTHSHEKFSQQDITTNGSIHSPRTSRDHSPDNGSVRSEDSPFDDGCSQESDDLSCSGSS